MSEKQNHTDIIHEGWVGRMPRHIRPYLYLMRLDRPIGTWLLLLPSWWAILLTGGLDASKTLILFAIGAIVMRGAGCVVNDLWDRDLDGRVERTATRPIPNGDVTVKQALLFLSILLIIGFIILIQFNFLTILLGVMSLVFVGVYPLMKRITWWPQAFLGLTFNFGALMGWSAVTDDVPWQAWVLYAAGFFWTLGYDTIYAFQDKDDDALIGIKSTARLFIERWPERVKYILFGFYAIHFCLLSCVVMSMSPLSPWILVMGIAFLHLMWQVITIDPDDPKNALTRFKSNRDYGLIMCAILILFTEFL